MIITTTPTIEGKQIVEYKGLVFGEVVSGANFIRDFLAVSPILLADVQVLMKAN
ncbi:Domain of uncharacterised function (DUF74) [Mannheimia haemolytica]|uniref:Domain of uncharacterized function (DUF74) n=1 Tax=Mannheimia haemolytica TaxID=75985 RepID=A0A378MZ57_MANHA|nr:Domain of uncharacterised function (DUF74) [Mannheimia haemolytica]